MVDNGGEGREDEANTIKATEDFEDFTALGVATNETGVLDLSKFQSSAERNIWSIYNPIWGAFPIQKPRLPRPEDTGVEWATKHVPDRLQSFLGQGQRLNKRCASDST
ncbi:unnamed protein product [Discosporangium mesarthrocarpum]